MKHKVITLLLSTVLFLSIFSLSVGTHSVAAASAEGIVTASSLNLHESSSTKSKSLTLLPKGTKVQVKSIKKSWMQIYVPSKKKSGWVAKKYISITKAATAKTASVTTTKYYVTADSLNVLASSSRLADVLTTIEKGEAVTYLSKKTSWGKIKTASGITGWVANRDLSTTTPAGTSNTEPKAETASTNTTQYVAVNSLDVMATSSRQAKVLTTLKKGAAVTYLSKKTSWGQIKTPSGITGWVANRDLSTTRPEGTSDSDPVVETVSNDLLQYVTVDELNIREEGNASADKVGEVNRGDAVTVIQIGDNGWGEIITEDGLIGWVNLYYLSDSVPTDGLEGKVIVLDPGHGGKDPGAAGDENKEKELTLATAKKVKTKLEAAGAKVLMTRTGDTYPTLSDRVAFSKKNKADVFISIHFNSSSSSSANGIDTFYWTTYKNEKALATYVQEAVIDSTGLKNRGVRTGNFQVIRENNMQAILIELGFISNPDEEAIIETSKFQNNAAEGIVNGLEAYFESL